MEWFRKLLGGSRRRGRPPTLAEEYDEISEEIDPSDLQRLGPDTEITEADVLGDLTGDHFHVRRISDYYTEEGFKYALERYGLLAKIRDLGFRDLRFDFDTADPKSQRIRCFGRKTGDEHLLMDLTTGRIHKPAPAGLEPPDDLELLSLEWMLLQNPTAEFAPDHPRWPGQDHPGLGLTDEVMLLHIQGAKRLELDGVNSHPSRYHVAFIGRGHVFFLDPAVQGRFDALREALSRLELSDATWRMERGEVRWRDDGSVFEWQPQDYVFPVSQRLIRYFDSPSYAEPRNEAWQRARARGITV